MSTQFRIGACSLPSAFCDCIECYLQFGDSRRRGGFIRTWREMPPLEVPNRLKGATINHEGDAV